VHYNIKELTKKGYIKTNPNNPSDYLVLDQQDTGITLLPLYSGAKCGPDGKFISDYETDEIPIPSKILKFEVSNALAIRAEGDSMEPKIPANSVVIVNKNENEYEPHNPFLIINNNQPLIKMLFIDNSKDLILLSSYNSKYEPFLANSDNFRIIGKVRAVFNFF